LGTAKTATSFGVGILGVYAGLFAPDIDLFLLPILHHRSIITHSIIIPLLLKRWLSTPTFAGFAAGISIHLWADSLSTSMGFAQVYLPVVKISLGSSMSLVWILLNAFLGFFIAVSVYRKFAWWIILAYLFVALLYAIFNESAIFIIYVFIVFSVFLFIFKSINIKYDKNERI
jgi:hypothetical protein